MILKTMMPEKVLKLERISSGHLVIDIVRDLYDAPRCLGHEAAEARSWAGRLAASE